MLEAFPGSQIVDVRSLIEPAAADPLAAGGTADDDVGYLDAVAPLDDLPDDDDL